MVARFTNPNSVHSSPTIGPLTGISVQAPHDAAVPSFAYLVRKLDYLEPADIRKVRDAYRFADEAHLGQFRA
ncbi:MAG: hypothetical protein ACK542_10245, partial [Burkholderiales bacterium]